MTLILALSKKKTIVAIGKTLTTLSFILLPPVCISFFIYVTWTLETIHNIPSTSDQVIGLINFLMAYLLLAAPVVVSILLLPWIYMAIKAFKQLIMDRDNKRSPNDMSIIYTQMFATWMIYILLFLVALLSSFIETYSI